MSMPANGKQREGRLIKYFFSLLEGKQTINNENDFKRFVEAIHVQQNSTATVERLVGNRKALEALRVGLRFSITAAFINQHTSKFITFLARDGNIKNLCNGQLLEQLLQIVLEPRTLWSSWINAFKSRKLEENAVYALLWMAAEFMSLPKSSGVDVISDVQELVSDASIFHSEWSSIEIRELGHKLKRFLQMRSSATSTLSLDYSPGGRHDNDHADFRDISILPTSDEFMSTAKPYYRRAGEIFLLSEEKRPAAHIDNQYRLLREDMLSELREDFQAAVGKKRKRRSALRMSQLTLQSIMCGRPEEFKKLRPCAISVTCASGMEQLSKMKSDQRVAYLRDNPKFLKHQSFGCLICDNEIVAFANIERDVDQLLKQPPAVLLQISCVEAFQKAILYLKVRRNVDFLLVDTAIFAYEPILKCLQEKVEFPLTEELFLYDKKHPGKSCNLISSQFIQSIKDAGDESLQYILETPSTIQLDQSQKNSILAGLSQRVSLIQGPPGTGKSFVGALLAKAFHLKTSALILVICYTNHALDQFLEDFLDIGIQSKNIVRLGSKSTSRTKPLLLSEQKFNKQRSYSAWQVINELTSSAENKAAELQNTFHKYRGLSGISFNEIMEFLEFEHSDFYEAFLVPDTVGDGMTVVDHKSKAMKKDYLFNRWIAGQTPGPFSSSIPPSSKNIWTMKKPARLEKRDGWIRTIYEEQSANLKEIASQYNDLLKRLDTAWRERDRELLQSKRIIGCTTTAAAMNSEHLRSIAPGIVLVEEAGEILESHVLTALSPDTKKLVLIGDHLQLRPKINNFEFTAEKGEGYDLNMSLFERLIRAGYPHTTLTKQHRMVPEISAFVRNLTYPELEDAPKAMNRPAPRGLQDRVIFFHHEFPEDVFSQIFDLSDDGSKQSKRNVFEAIMVLQIVKYMGQQGYGTDNLVVLTPYLGQLHLLRDILRKDNDPVLNDLDSHDLIKAGLMSQAAASTSKRKIKLSTIDNYQGEESDIVIASLTRSNSKGDIGFMAAPQRLNVLMSRARDVIILLGNQHTFAASRKGKEAWVPFFKQLASSGHLYDGFPVKCQKHPSTKTLLKSKNDFEEKCPDGGCSVPCGVQLKCGVHYCPSRCHQLVDHSKMECKETVSWRCDRGHIIHQICSQADRTCRKCRHEDRVKEEKRKRDEALEARREFKQKEYLQKLQKIDDEAAQLRLCERERREDEEMDRILTQRMNELKLLKKKITRSATIFSPSAPVQPDKSDYPQKVPDSYRDPVNIGKTNEQEKRPPDSQFGKMFLQGESSKNEEIKPKKSAAKDTWEKQKKYHNAQSDEIDALMDMIGLESIKDKFLGIKAKADTSLRQGVELKEERYGAVLLGNPGTGKTTVARIYAKFLEIMGSIPGNAICETSGSGLANNGVNGCKALLEKILNGGGGALFIDEAYQLVPSQMSMGSPVLDFLLAEVENLRGKIVFILAGYQRHMEKLFSHNPGIPSRFPIEFKFEDYDEKELHAILEYGLKKKYKGNMKVEGGPGGLYCRIVARRVSRERGREGFANARAVENVRDRISERQSLRLEHERMNSTRVPDDFFMTKEDLIGPEPANALSRSSAWKELNQMIGLDSVKKTVQALLDSIQYNYYRELQEKPLTEFSLNRVFLGNPGTGKTSIAKLYGQILVDIGLLSNGEVLVRNPSDFIGSVIGESEKNTRAILEAAKGKVLVIDEAYGLFGGGTDDGTGPKSDIFRTAVVDTIVAEVQGVPGEDRSVLLLGYKEKMEQMFQKVNPGLSRRFPIDQAFNFEDFNTQELNKILTLKLKKQGFEVTDLARKVALEMLERSRNRPNFGNAGEIDNILNAARMNFQKRVSENPQQMFSMSTLQPEDFDKDYDRGNRQDTDVANLFQGVIGCDEIISKLNGYRKIVQNTKNLGMEPRDQIPFNFLFRGPPGTGKTSTARKMGRIYYDMGLLSSDEVIESSVSDLLGQYIGHTGPKTRQVLEKGLGKILFIDEAYRLAGGGYANRFGQEAMDEIVDCVTKPRFAGRLIIILAGYDQDINKLMAANSGLTSRFPESIQFNGLTPVDSVRLLNTLFRKRRNNLKEEGKGADLDISVLESPDSAFSQRLLTLFEFLSKTANWANARDVETLVKGIYNEMLVNLIGNILVLTKELVLKHIEAMKTERSARAKDAQPMDPMSSRLLPESIMTNDPPLKSGTNANISTNTTGPVQDKNDNADPSLGQNGRENDVPDDVWQQLEKDKAAADASERDYVRSIQEQTKRKEECNNIKMEERNIIHEQKEAEQQANEEEMKRLEQERIRRELQRRKEEDDLEKIRRHNEEVKRQRQVEQQVQKNLQKMGVCPVGFRWIKQQSGYRCAGGSHFVTNAQLGL